MSAVDMAEVGRLTRAGRLTDATALIQAGLAGVAPASAGDRRPSQSLRLIGPIDTTRPTASASPNSSRFRAPPARARFQSVSRPFAHKAFEVGGRVRPNPSLPEGASFETKSVTNAAGTLDYKLYVPARRVFGPLPLVVMLHGCTQDPNDFAAGTRMNEFAEQYGFLVAYPAQAQTANSSRCWNWFKSGDQGRDRGEPSLIADATRQILADQVADSKRVFVAGLSAGGAAAAIMGCAYPDLYAGIGVHSGLACGAASNLHAAFAAMRGGSTSTAARLYGQVPTIVFHGSADRTVDPANAISVTEQVVQQAEPSSTEHGTTSGGTGFTKKVWLGAGGRAAAEQWMVEGAGHAWFGGSPTGTYTEMRGPDASREMLRFFGIIPDEDASVT